MPTLNKIPKEKPPKGKKKKPEGPPPDPRVPCATCPASRKPHDMPQMTVSPDTPGFCLTRGIHGIEPLVTWGEALLCPGSRELDRLLDNGIAPPKPTG